MSIPLRVLFVEDMEYDVTLMVRELERGGFVPIWQRVDTALAMQEALQEQWDIVISDYAMPSFSGVEALLLLQHHDTEIPFIIVSGAIGEQTAVEVMKAGAQDYFLKSSIARLPIAVERELRDDQVRRKQRASAAALSEIQARFHAFMNAAPMPAWIKDTDSRYLYVNPAQSAFFGLTPTQMIGMSDLDLMTGGAAQNTHANDQKVRSSRREMHTQEIFIDAAHRPRILDVTRFPLISDNHILAAGLAIDVTEQVQSKNELELAMQRQQILASRVIEVQERERQHLARGLHDDVGQSLTALKINLETIKKSGSLDGQALQNGIDIVCSVLSQVRCLSLDLRPPQLDNLGLITTLRSYVENKASLANLKCYFESTPLPLALHHDIENTCFRIVQEVVTNILRHAMASNIWVLVMQHEDQLHVSVRDDGRGFDLYMARKNAVSGISFGLLNMEERAALVGGTMEMSSVPGRGTEIIVQLPVVPVMRRS